MPLAPGLYIVATPIGHSRDITLRALEVLARADLVACEDTRRSQNLFAIHGIRNRLISYHEHNAARRRPALLERLAAGQAIALISDAGTPLISDPGYRLVTEAVAAGIAVYPIPGASSVLAALTVAALPTDRFLFLGFLPARAALRRRRLREIAALAATLVVLESPRRLAASLRDLAEVLGDRPAAIARELTKLHEQVRRDRLPALARAIQDEGPPLGEIVIVIGPPAAESPDRAEAGDQPGPSIDQMLRAALAVSGPAQAAARVAAATGKARRELYQRALSLRRARNHGDQDQSD